MNNLRKALSRLKTRIQTDYDASQAQKLKYQKDYEKERLSTLLVKDIGLQSMAAVRLMQFADEANIPLGGQILSRLIRYVYNMEIHWEADIASGVTLVHGGGLVISKHAHIGSNCTIAHNVTFGASWNPKTGATEGPTLEDNVFVGPGACLLGPITIGANSKIMAGAVVSESVPPNTIVKPAAPSLSARATARPEPPPQGHSHPRPHPQA